jgi:2-succinyl-6-hydroxy-2,4-cyclohexadiene-1-carboxylate synthase
MRAICVHGFTQTAHSWSDLIAVLGAEPFEEILALDAPGHGSQQHRQLPLPAGARDIGERGGPGVYIGYSMGARLCLHLALDRPDLVNGLVMIGGTPGIEDPTERAARRAADEALADQIETIGVEAFLHRWLTQPLFATLPTDHAGAAERTTNSAAALAESLRTAGTGTQTPLWDRISELSMPVLLITGELDGKFTEIAQRCMSLIPRCHHAVIPATGHAVHLEDPLATAHIISDWWSSEWRQRVAEES